jgi:hypothetical protein
VISLMRHTYLMDIENIQKELDKLWDRYYDIINSEVPTWDEVNEARALLYLTGGIYCEKIAPEAIERRLHLLEVKLSLIEFLDLIDKESNRLDELRRDKLFVVLEKFYRVVKGYKNKYVGGRYYREEERFLKKYDEVNPDKRFSIGYRGGF